MTAVMHATSPLHLMFLRPMNSANNATPHYETPSENYKLCNNV